MPTVAKDRLTGFYLGFLFLGGEDVVDGGRRHRPQFSRGVWGHAPQKFEPSESGSEAF